MRSDPLQKSTTKKEMIALISSKVKKIDNLRLLRSRSDIFNNLILSSELGEYKLQTYGDCCHVVHATLTDYPCEIVKSEQVTNIVQSQYVTELNQLSMGDIFLYCDVTIHSVYYPHYIEYLGALGRSIPNQTLTIVIPIDKGMRADTLDTAIYRAQSKIAGYVEFISEGFMDTVPDLFSRSGITHHTPRYFAKSIMNHWRFDNHVEFSDHTVYMEPTISTMFHCDHPMNNDFVDFT